MIFLSSLDETKDKVRGLEVGAVDFVSKPFQSDEVVARVNTHLTLQRLRRQLEARNAELARELAVAQRAPDGRAAPGRRPAARRQPRDPGAARIDRTIRRRRGSPAADRTSRCRARGGRPHHPPRLAAQPPGLHPRQLRTAASGAGPRHPEPAGGSLGAGIRLAPEPAGAGHPRHAVPRRNPATARRPAGTVGRSPRARRGLARARRAGRCPTCASSPTARRRSPRRADSTRSCWRCSNADSCECRRSQSAPTTSRRLPSSSSASTRAGLAPSSKRSPSSR